MGSRPYVAAIWTKCNNQLKVSVSGGGDIIEEMQLGRNMWEGCRTIVWGGKLRNEKMAKDNRTWP
jgi:hypothetical protein